MKEYLQKLIERIKKNPLYRWASYKSKTTTFPGFGGVPIYYVIQFFIREAKKDDLTTRANSMAYSFFISLFPFLILLFSLASFLPIGDLRMTLEESLAGVMPGEAKDYILNLVDQLINQIFTNSKGGLISVGFVLVLYFSSNGILSMIRGFNKDYSNTFKYRNWIQNRLVAIKLTLVMGFILMLTAPLFFSGNYIIGLVDSIAPSGPFTRFLIQAFRWFLIVLLTYSLFNVIYHYGPALRKKFKLFSLGATVATIMSLTTSTIFSYYVNTFGQYNKFYGSLGALIILLLWMQINCFIVLVGFELNTSIAVQRHSFDEEHRKEEIREEGEGE